MPDSHLNRLLIDKVVIVEVRILVPGPHQDQALVALANDERIIPLLQAGAELHTYMPSMMHAKIVTVDGALAMFGSANFNYRSLRKDDELIVTTSDARSWSLSSTPTSTKTSSCASDRARRRRRPALVQTAAQQGRVLLPHRALRP